ncbi:MAG: hypothetical protein WC444_05825 [Candidatus Paceibacterota bacterium]
MKGDSSNPYIIRRRLIINKIDILKKEYKDDLKLSEDQKILWFDSVSNWSENLLSIRKKIDELEQEKSYGCTLSIYLYLDSTRDYILIPKSRKLSLTVEEAPILASLKPVDYFKFIRTDEVNEYGEHKYLEQSHIQ